MGGVCVRDHGFVDKRALHVQGHRYSTDLGTPDVHQLDPENCRGWCRAQASSRSASSRDWNCLAFASR